MSSAASLEDVQRLRREFLGLFDHIRQFRKELASIRKPGNTDDDHFATMADQLDAIVESTEHASNTIMESMEQIEDLLGQVRKRSQDAETLALLDQVSDRGNAIFEACAFQDLTGQRITKVVKSLQFVEERVSKMVKMWGPDAIAKEKVEGAAETDPDKKLLNGPQLPGKGVSQDSVDALFDQNDIDKLFG